MLKRMSRTAVFVLAASLVFPFLASWAAEPGSEASGTPTPETQRELLELRAAEADALRAGRETARLYYPGLEQAGTGWIDLPTPVPAPRVRENCLATGSGDAQRATLCDFAAEVARARPCLAAKAEDCPISQAWQRVMGTPGVRQAPQMPLPAVLSLATPGVPEPKPSKAASEE